MTTSAELAAAPSAPAGETNQHYDLDPEIFGLFLDPLRKYSSGLYRRPGLTLAEAQVAKLHFVADRLRLAPGQRLLDVGCGWGSLILFMAREYRAEVTGVSPAGRQHEFIAARAAQLGLTDLVSTRVGKFADVELPARSFDAVTMLGSIVHMPDVDAAVRRARSMLRRGGHFYVSESCFRNAAAREEFDRRAGTEFVRNSIFGWGDMRPLSELVRAVEDAGFSVTSVDDLTDDYRRTIDDWLERVAAGAAAIDELRPGTSAELTRYLEVANAGWGFTTKHYALVCRNAR
ncbi:methyltransferase, cyclopropane fatty acid synthase [Frankia torreyi]|uniref:Methyltransferase, cyclopropane fatty acid synthase n=1 Tax=Frankia torreyi TaxID=1856 RepID=A0A0D8BAB1_9ACTN|nr:MULTISPECIES: class I SAM-dependent methyltransferase [Frankia]KJE20297.1 methyltransferase, cyclopropane fatty acid synthase [Frankia torreyi]KQC35165.1 cyclopropane-fatty-acyl-phospholipid synthase [Frankia sp. ACN1ag]KQM05309.1 methyltransferase, cyclopropane fatty acid synthase [Frankia sp. CpI1-P]